MLFRFLVVFFAGALLCLAIDLIEWVCTRWARWYFSDEREARRASRH